jgi:hypothetical protein
MSRKVGAVHEQRLMQGWRHRDRALRRVGLHPRNADRPAGEVKVRPIELARLQDARAGEHERLNHRHKKNQGQTLSWSGFSLANGAAASLTVTVSGTVSKGAACGSSLPISGSWSASGQTANKQSVSSGPSTQATITISCP